MDFLKDTGFSLIPPVIILLPLAFSFLVPFLKKRKESTRDLTAVFFAGITFFLSALLYLKAGEEAAFFALPGFLGWGLNFSVGPLGAFFTLLSSFIWFLAVLFSLTYMGHEHARPRYYAFLSLTQAGCLGVFLAGDLFSLFIFFEVMSLASYALVVHTETEEAMEAGRLYLFLGVAGGLSLLTGILLLNSFTGSVSLAPLFQDMTAPAYMRYLTAGFLLLGFGIKAGMAPVHIWLPKAHPVAPSPASALLSGIMIKTGAYGILRVAAQAFAPETGGFLGSTSSNLGFVILWTGIATMFMAAFIALFQTNIKRILAYSSVSQMGYILMGVGCAAYLGPEGPMGFTGTVFHIFNHAFFKAGMFMMAGAVYARTHELDLDRLGGLWRKFPVTSLCFAVAACGIAGVPGFNGYASKTLLHHAVEEAAHQGSQIFLYAEKIFVITSALTVCYILKLTLGVFFGPEREDRGQVGPEPLLEKLVFGLFAAAVILAGVFPKFLLTVVIIPLTEGFGFDPYRVNYLEKLDFWARPDLLAIGTALSLGVIFYLFFSKTGLFYRHPPRWLSIESLLYTPLVRGTVLVYTLLGSSLERGVDKAYVKPGPWFTSLFSRTAAWESKAAGFFTEVALKQASRMYTGIGSGLDHLFEVIYVQSGIPFKALARRLAYFDAVTLTRAGQAAARLSVGIQDKIYSRWCRLASCYDAKLHRLMRRTFVAFIKADYDTKGDPFYQMINPMNYNFDLVVVWLVLLVILLLGVR